MICQHCLLRFLDCDTGGCCNVTEQCVSEHDECNVDELRVAVVSEAIRGGHAIWDAINNTPMLRDEPKTTPVRIDSWSDLLELISNPAGRDLAQVPAGNPRGCVCHFYDLG